MNYNEREHLENQVKEEANSALEAEKTWKRIKGHHLICKVIEGIKFFDGEVMEIKQEAA